MSSPSGGPPRLEDIPTDITPRQVGHRLEVLVYELQPMMEFYQRALGVLAVVRWLGPITTILLFAILAVLVLRPVPVTG